MVAPSIVRELYTYDPLEGHLRWRHGFRAGQIAGTKHSAGYIQVRVGGKSCKAHRIIWVHYYGEQPPRRIDHEDTDNSNNKIKNLRPATPSQNGANSRKPITNTTGFKGVTFYRGSYRAQIYKEGRNHHIGVFDNPEDAHSAYCIAAVRLHGEYARFA